MSITTIESDTEISLPAASDKQAIVARLERLPGNRMHIRARLLVGLATFFDGFDVIIIATTLPLMIVQWGLTPAQIGLLIMSGTLGQLAGSLLFPYLAERYGRLNSIAWSCGIIGFMSIACGLAPGFMVFVILRTLQGIGLGGELPVAATYINEITRAKGRGRFVLLYEVVFPIGLLASSMVGAWVVPRYGWEMMYFIGGIPAILFFVLRLLVPESPRWLCEKNRMEEAEEAISRFESAAKTPLPPFDAKEMAVQIPRVTVKREVKDLLGQAYLPRTIAVWAMWITCGFIQYGLTTWLPTIYQEVYHVSLQLALNLAIIPSMLAVFGSILCALIVDKVGRKPVITCAFILCALSLAAAGIFHEHSVYLVATFCSLAFGFMGCGFITAYVYTPELYPTSIRAIGCGVGGAWLKVAALVAPMVVAQTMATGNLNSAFYILGSVPLLAALLVYRLGVETKGKVLEELEV